MSTSLELIDSELMSPTFGEENGNGHQVEWVKSRHVATASLSSSKTTSSSFQDGSLDQIQRTE